jgi:hypothetical protein
VSLTRPAKPAFIALLLVALAWLSDRRVIAAWRARSPLFLYAIATVAMVLFALGPVGRVFGQPFLYEAPYSWLMRLPGGDGLRVPARFAMLVMLCLSQAAAVGFSRLAPAAGRSLVAAVALGVLVDGWVSPFWIAPVHQAAALRDDGNRHMPLLEVPISDGFSETAAMLRATGHGHPLFNGTSGYSPRHYDLLYEGVRAADPSILAALQRLGPFLAVVNRDNDPKSMYSRYVRRASGSPPIYRSEFGRVYRLPRKYAPNAPDGVEELQIDHVAVSNNAPQVNWLLDRDLGTRWDTAWPQRRGDQVVVAFREPVRVTRFEMDLAAATHHYPRRLRIEVADHGTPPATVWEGGTSGLALLGAIADSQRLPVVVDLDVPAVGRRFTLTLRERHRTFPWSIAELRAYGLPGSANPGAQATSPIESPAGR